MANKILISEQDGTPKQICFADHGGDFSPAAGTSLEFGAPTDVQITLAALADTAARQSAKVDLGTERAQVYKVRAAFEFAATPDDRDMVELYWAPSSSSTAANGNAGNIIGADAAYAGYSANLESSLLQLDMIGVFMTTVQATGTVQVAEVGFFSPSERYGSLVVNNESGANFHSNDIESHVVFDPVVPEVQ